MNLMELRWTQVRLALATCFAVAISIGCAGEPSDSGAGTREDPAAAQASEADGPVEVPFWEAVAAPELPLHRNLTAGFLIVDGVYNSELMAPYDILQHTRFHTEPWIDVFTVSPDGRPVVTFEGLTVEAHYSFANVPDIDILIVPSAEHSMDTDLENTEMIEWVSRVGDDAMYVMSLCDGAFVLAKAGLLDEVSSTTFPSDQDAYEEMFPILTVLRDVSFVHDGKALTSQGGAKSYDVSMYLVDLLYGEKVAAGVGRGLIIDWPPDPAQMTAWVNPDCNC